MTEPAPMQWILVPREPTEEMVAAAVASQAGKRWDPAEIYQAMLAAAPAPTQASASADQEIARLRAEVERLEKLVYVPGIWRCAKCGLSLMSTNLHVDSGKMSVNNEPQQCANGCGPMWRKTEREAGNELCGRLDAAADGKRDAERRLAEIAVILGELHSDAGINLALALKTIATLAAQGNEGERK